MFYCRHLPFLPGSRPPLQHWVLFHVTVRMEYLGSLIWVLLLMGGWCFWVDSLPPLSKCLSFYYKRMNEKVSLTPLRTSQPKKNTKWNKTTKSHLNLLKVKKFFVFLNYLKNNLRLLLWYIVWKATGTAERFLVDIPTLWFIVNMPVNEIKSKQ